MTAARPVEISMFPEVKPDRPVGALVGSVIAGTNADLIATIAPLYLEGRTVLDVTYGRGGWWKRWRPEHLTAHDIDPAKGDGIDFRALPEADRSFDVVCFDPPYIPQGGVTTSTEPGFIDAFGLQPMSQAGLWRLMEAGLSECARVASEIVIMKCCDFVNGGRFNLGHVKAIELGRQHGLALHDLVIHHTGSGPGGHNIIRPKRARRHHSYLLVFGVRR